MKGRSIEPMEMLFLLLGFAFFVKGCTGLTLHGEVGGTVVFACNSTSQDIEFIYFQGGTGFKDFIIGYHKKKPLDDPSRPDTYLNHEDKTVTFENLTISDEGTYECIVSHGVGEGKTEDTTITTLRIIEPPPTPSIKIQSLVCDVSCALKCTADTQDLGPVSYEWKKDEGEWTKGDELKNISSSDTPEKFFCRLITHVRTSNSSLPMVNPLYKPVAGLTVGAIIRIIIVILCIVALIAVIALVKFLRNQQPVPQDDPEDPVGNQQLVPQQDPDVTVQPAHPLQPAHPVQPADQVQPANGVAVAEDLEMETLNNTNSNENK